MNTESRQVFKPRKGEIIHVSKAKKRRFNSIVYLDSELKKLDLLLDDNEVDLEELISSDDQEKLKDGYYLRYIRNQYSLAGRPTPFNLTITVKLGKKEIPNLIEDILNCFRLPLTIGIDFWAVLASLSRPQGDILFPSRATACNKTQRIRTTKDIEILQDEFKQLPAENIIQKHFVNESSSGMSLQNLLALEIYISKNPFQ